MKDKELKPCAHCGSEPLIMRMSKRWVIGCPDCEIEISGWTTNTNTTCQVEKVRLNLIDKWNTRTSDKQIEELKDENRKLAETLDFLDTFIRGCEINHDIGYVGYPAQERVSNALGKLNKEITYEYC